MADPAQITAARIQAIVDEWIDFIDGNARGAQWICARPNDALTAGWNSELSDGLWWENVTDTLELWLPFVQESSMTITALAALVYVSSSVPGEQPFVELVEVSSAGASILTTPPTPTAIGWHLLTWTGSELIGSNSVVMLRGWAGQAGDRIATAIVYGDRL